VPPLDHHHDELGRHGRAEVLDQRPVPGLEDLQPHELPGQQCGAQREGGKDGGPAAAGTRASGTRASGTRASGTRASDGRVAGVVAGVTCDHVEHP
jgi:hypothetical protein